jgi:hypothetical protein
MKTGEIFGTEEKKVACPLSAAYLANQLVRQAPANVAQQSRGASANAAIIRPVHQTGVQAHLLDAPGSSQSGLKYERLAGTATAGSSILPRLWRAAPALAPAASQRLRTIEQVAAKATKRSASA